MVSHFAQNDDTLSSSRRHPALLAQGESQTPAFQNSLSSWGCLEAGHKYLWNPVNLTLLSQANATGNQAFSPSLIKGQTGSDSWECESWGSTGLISGLLEENRTGGNTGAAWPFVQTLLDPAQLLKAAWTTSHLSVTTALALRYVTRSEEHLYWPICPLLALLWLLSLSCFNDVNQMTRLHHQHTAAPTTEGLALKLKPTTHVCHWITINRATLPGPGGRILLHNISDPPQAGATAPAQQNSRAGRS